MRTYHSLRVGDVEFHLRLTIRGQKNLAQRFGEDALQTVIGAAGDSTRMAALLEEALSWEGSGNALTDGEVFYDRLVDQGYRGQVQFSGLAFDIAVASGLLTTDQAGRLKRSVAQAVEDVFSHLDDNRGAAETAPPFGGQTD